jgi:uncharacterized membrane protein (UPF0127 family)
MRWLLVLSISIAPLAACSGAAPASSGPVPPSTVTFGGADAKLHVEIADDTDERRQGLMGVEHLPADRGMAFVWPDPVDSTFWMKNTLVPLSIAFVDDAGYVIDVLDMEPCREDPCPRYGIGEPYVLAVEANLGWFDDHGVRAGDRAELRAGLYG